MNHPLKRLASSVSFISRFVLSCTSIVGCCLFGLSSRHARADSLVISDNLAAPTAYTETVQGQTWVGAEFQSDGAATLANVSLLLANVGTGNAELDLYSGAAQPETLVGSLTSPAGYSSTLTPTMFSGNGLTLTAATSYWLVLHALSDQFAWAYTNSSTGSGVGFLPSWGVSDDAGSTWFTQASEPMQMQVQVTTPQATPEPASLSLWLLGMALLVSFATGGRSVRKRASSGRSLLMWGGALTLVLSGARTAAAATNSVSIVSPAFGERVTTLSAVSVTLQVNPAKVGVPLQVILNGIDVSALFRRSGHCGAQGCPYQGTIQESDGLRKGNNGLQAGLKTYTESLPPWRTVFAWRPGGQPGSSQDTPTPALGLTTVTPGGGYPWISLFDNEKAAPNNASIGVTATYPSSQAAACTTTYQVVLLDRTDPASSIPTNPGVYRCYATDTDLTAALGSSDFANKLVIAGTTYGQIAGKYLDTTPIGGTNYTANTNAVDYPYGYIVVGVQGAPPGQAYENASTGESNPNDPANFARVNGLLAINPQLLFDFHPSDYMEFSVRPKDPSTPEQSASISTGVDATNGIKYTPPAGTNGFWLLLLDRRNLFSKPSCDASNPKLYEHCGTFYNTGFPETPSDLITDTAKAISEQNRLATDLSISNAGKSRLIFLVSVGTPIFNFQGTPIVSQNLTSAIDNLGASGYTLERVPGVSSPAYTLVSSNDTGFQETFTGSAVVSNNIDQVPGSSTNAQTGFVHGVLGRDNHGLFRPVASSQESSATIDTPQMSDFSGYSIFWSQPVSWPLVDTPGHVAAYRYLSYQWVTAVIRGTTGPSATGPRDDVRKYYFGGDVNDLIDGKYNPGTASCPSGTFSFNDPVDGQTYTFTSQDCSDVSAQLSQELTDLLDDRTFGNNIYGALFSGNNAIVTAMFSAISAVNSSTALADAAQAKADKNVAKWLKLGGSLIAAVPGGGAPATVVSTVFKTVASSATPPGVDSADLASAFASYESTVSDIYNAQDAYNTNLKASFATVYDNLHSDWGKLDQIAAKTGSSWSIDYIIDLVSINQEIVDSTNRYFYLQALAGSYSLDSWLQQTVQWPWQIGAEVYRNSPRYSCETVYANLPQYSWFSYLTPGNTTQYDIFIIGGKISDNNTSYAREEFPSQALLNKLFGAPLNPPPQDTSADNLSLQQDLFFALHGPLSRRQGAVPAPIPPQCNANP